MARVSASFSEKLDRVERQIEDTEKHLANLRNRQASLKKQDCLKSEIVNRLEHMLIERFETEIGIGYMKLIIVAKNE